MNDTSFSQNCESSNNAYAVVSRNLLERILNSLEDEDKRELYDNSYIHVSNNLLKHILNSSEKNPLEKKTNQELSKKSSIPVNGYLFERIITSSEQSFLEKLFYILTHSLSHINCSKKKPRAVALSAISWAKRLNCSKSNIFDLQKNLTKQGLFSISKEKNLKGQNNKNIITPTLPENLKHLNSLNDNLTSTNVENFSQNKEKLYIKLNYYLLKLICSNESTNPFQKILWLDFYIRHYKSYIKTRGQGDNYFTASYEELMNKFKVSKSTLSKSLTALEKAGFIKRERFSIINEENNLKKLSSRANHSLWKFAISLPNLPNEQEENITDYFNISFTDPTFSLSGQQYIEKSFINKTVKERKNIDNKDTTEQVLNNSSKGLSKFLKNDSLEKKSEILQKFSTGIKNSKINISVKNVIEQGKIQPKTLKDYYPLNERQIIKIQKKSGREFNGDFINKLLEKLNAKYLTKLFDTENHFIAYMSIVLSKELHQPQEVNREDFKFAVNSNNQQDKREKSYLKTLEENRNTNKLTQLKKKIAGMFEQSKAYRLLTESIFYLKQNDNFIVMKIPKSIELMKLQQKTLEQQIKEIFKGGSIEFTKDDQKQNEIKREITELEKKTHMQNYISQINTATIWGKIRSSLIRYFDKEGVSLDEFWFSKLEPKIDEDMKILTLKSPDNYVTNHIKEKYGSLIAECSKQLSYEFNLIE